MEKIPPRTYEVQAKYILGLQVLQDWVDWAVEAIVAGYDSQSLRILAGLQPPFDDQEINRLSNRTFGELNIIPLKKENCIPYYIDLILRQTSDNKLTQRSSRKIEGFMSGNKLQKTSDGFLSALLRVIRLRDLRISRVLEGCRPQEYSQNIDDYFLNWLKNHGQNVPV